MGIAEKRRKEIFSQLDDLASLNLQDLEQEFSKLDESIMDDLMAELFESEDPCSYDTQEKFVDCIYKMKSKKSEWSRKIGHMLLVLDNLIHKEDKSPAIEHINNFISSCEVPYFRFVAENEKSKL